MTAQVPEALILDGRRCDMTTCPLKEDHPRVRPRRPDEEEAPAPRDPLDLAMDEGPARYVGSTACWRGYVGTWEIRDKRLYLVKLQGRFVLDGDEPLFADWVHQTVAVPQGRLVQYVHMGFQSRYESELWIDISGGVETKRETIEGGLQALIDRLLASKPVIADLAIIAGPQTGIYPSETPGGWVLVGRTPFRPFQPAGPEPFLLKAGDAVRFVPIDDAQYRRLAVPKGAE